MIYVIEDDPIMAELIAKACQRVEGCKARIFPDAVAALDDLDDDDLPEIIFLDILLTGPDGFTLLNELASYQNTARIPVVIVSSLNLQGQDLSSYGVVAILDKATMHPEDIAGLVREWSHAG